MYSPQDSKIVMGAYMPSTVGVLKVLLLGRWLKTRSSHGQVIVVQHRGQPSHMYSIGVR